MRETFKYAWDVLTTPIRFKEITAPATAQISADTLALYAKDRSGVSGLYFKDDAGVEHDLGAITSPQALTRVNDTNVTLTLGGTPATALLQAVSLTLGWSGTLGLARGGTAADLSATGGAGKVLKQTSLGGAVTVATVAASEIASGAALTKTDDTNVTLTLGGAPTTALLAAASLTLGWTGTLGVARGGTNIGSYAVGDILYASASATLSKLADVAAGSYLRSGGVTTAPLWSTLILPNAATANRIVYASSSNTYGESADLAFDGTDLILGSGIRARMSGQNRFRYLNTQALATETSDQTLSDSTITVLTYTAADIFDTDTIHDTVTNPSRLIAKLSGKYYVSAFARFAANATGQRVLFLEKNAAGTHSNAAIFSQNGQQAVSIAGQATTFMVSGFISLSANDYVECFAYQDSGGSLAIQNSVAAGKIGMFFVGE